MEIAVAVPAFPLSSSNKILLFQILFRILFLAWVTLRKHRWVTFAERRSARVSSASVTLLNPRAREFPHEKYHHAMPLLIPLPMARCISALLIWPSGRRRSFGLHWVTFQRKDLHPAYCA